MRRHIDPACQLSLAEHFYEPFLVDETRTAQDLRADLGAVQAFQGVQVDHRVLDPEGVLEALQLRDPLSQGQLASLETGLGVVASTEPFGASACCLAPLACDTTSDAATGL